LRATLPPYFSGDALRFAGIDDLRAARADLAAVGAVLAVCDGSAPAGAVEVRCAVGASESRGRVRVMISPAQPGTVVVQAQKKDDWQPVLDELDPPMGRVSSQSFPGQGTAPSARHVAFTLPMSGTLRNPTTPRGVIALPVHRPVSESDTRVPSVPLLLRWLRTTRGVFRVELAADGVPVHSLCVVDGREVRSPVSLATLGKAMAQPSFTYEITEVPRAPNWSHTGRTLHLIVEVIRGMLSAFEPDDIAAAFPHTSDGRLVRAVGSVADALGYQGPLARLVKTSLQGDDSVRGVVRAAAGARAAWDVLGTLELFGGLSFMAGEPRRQTPEPMMGVGVAPAAERPAILDKDLYTVLGLHWSCAPSEVGDAYQRTRRDFGPGGSRRPTNHKMADEIMGKIEEAYRTLSNAEARRTYRAKTFNMIWPHQATLLVQQAKLAIYRKDVAEARNLLNAAQDMAPSAEAAALLDVLIRGG